mmetsp:Transcript_8370/g.12595  ORF Transcript_8370/g.12595 Transcript_8370/m.12595 type:complete len:539 (+) Transcript_8370:58-1674(+)
MKVTSLMFVLSWRIASSFTINSLAAGREYATIPSQAPFVYQTTVLKQSTDGASSTSSTGNQQQSSTSKPTSSTVSGHQQKQYFDEKQLDFTMGYLNKHHRDVLRLFVEVFSELGAIQVQKNAFSGGSYEIIDARVIDIDYRGHDHLDNDDNDGEDKNVGFLLLEATVQVRNKKEPTVERVQVSLDAQPIRAVSRLYKNLPSVPNKTRSNHINDFVRRMNRLCYIVRKPGTTGKLTQLAYQIGGDKSLILKENLYLNQVPHNRYVRQYFYDAASQAVLDAVIACSNGVISNRMKMTVMFPEMNPQMDSYRIGTLLEITRAMAITLAEQNLRVRVCVQGSMGVGIFTGTPKQLSGASTLLQRMDWQSNEGEQNEGMVGNYVNFGAVGKEHVVNSGVDRRGNKIEQDDVFIILCPQSMVGIESSIIGPLSEMVDAAGDRPVILLNPDLVDKVSSQGQQSVRGRKERIDFAESFQTIFHFQNIYVSGTSYFPILGATTKTSFDQAWISYQRRDRLNNEGEVYVPILSSEDEPDGEVILKEFE